MKRAIAAGWVVVTIAVAVTAGECPPPPPGFPRFTWQEIAGDFKIGYAVHIADVNDDKKPDIVVVDKDRVVWYENPTWKMRVITQGKTKPDNVCICSLDIDRDGKLDFVVGAGWKPFDTKTPGTLQWFRRGKTLDEEWEMFPIPCDEPLVHRVQVIANDIIMAPLMGRDATKANNWMDGRPVRVMRYRTAGDPTNKNNWSAETVNESLHVVHNLTAIIDGDLTGLVLASYEGIHMAVPAKNQSSVLQAGNQSQPLGSRGCSEIAATLAWPGIPLLIATVEPWHGNQIVINAPNDQANNKPYPLERRVIDSQLRWGHAIKIEKITDEHFIIAGVRDNPDPKQGDTFTEKRGVRLYRKAGDKWERYILEDGGVAVEDLQVADLDGDDKPEIIAVGRATGNCRIYWNKGK